MRTKHIGLPFMALMLTFILHSCSKSSGSPGNATPGDSIQLRVDSHFGSVLTDAKGNSLYFFALDADGTSACTGGCLSVWPAVYVASPTFGPSLNTSDFSSITRTDGSKQTTYKGWPLYRYAPDINAGDIHGDGVEGVWFIGKPDYTVMLAETQLVGNDGISYTKDYVAGTGSTLFITDDRGVTLYSFSKDKAGTNTFTKSDFSNDASFPIYQIATVQSVPSAIDKAAFSSITVFGKPQLTYKGWPAYYFGADAHTRGSTKGVSVPTPGFWPVMTESSPAAP